MKRRWPWICMLLPPSFGACYMVWLMWSTHAEGQWMFTVLAAFFLALLVAVLLPRRPQAAPARGPEGTRFASQRALAMAIVVIVLLVLAITVNLFRRV